MFSVTRFCVQPFERRRSELARGEPRLFNSEAAAIDYAEHIGRRSVGVVIVCVTGWPVHNIWGKPRLIMSSGDLPPNYWEGMPY